MSLTPRPYTGLQDFIIMTAILAVGRKTARSTYYAHPGDLSWWLFYDYEDESHWRDDITLWEVDGRVVGWSLFDISWRSFDIYLLPEMRNTTQETEILDWTIATLSERMREKGEHQLSTVWISEKDTRRIARLEQRGFELAEHFMWYMEQPLNAEIPDAVVPSDFVVRSLHGEDDLHLRATASHDAFGAKRVYDEYWPRYQKFMHSPVYNPNFDLVTEGPDGNFASFCIVWPDPVNRVGLFEPVGTHTQYQRLGLGRAVVSAGLRRLQSWGMQTAMVCAEHDNPAAQALYQAVGFEKKHKLLTFNKNIR